MKIGAAKGREGFYPGEGVKQSWFAVSEAHAQIVAIALVTRGGKVILSRQNAPIARVRLEGLLATFSRVVAASTATCVETDGYRFLYRLMDDVYVVCVTPLSSNIVDDTAVLTGVIAAMSQKIALTSRTATQGMFELLFIVDEFLLWGTAEKLPVRTVMQNVAMKSKDEELYLRELEAKKQEALRIAKRREEEIKEEKELRERILLMQNLQTLSQGYLAAERDGPAPAYTADYVPIDTDAPKTPAKKPTKKEPKRTGGGLQLGKKKPNQALVDAFKQEADDAELL